MAQPAFDHLVIAAETLAEGEAWLTGLLGVVPEPGGKHDLMGTHNRLWRLGPREYLELIAVDPEAVAPPYPRWFGLDDFSGPPRLVAWVMRAASLTTPPDGSTIMQAARGDLRWRITIPDSGISGHDGLMPLMIDWGEGPHPTDRMSDHGLRLNALQLNHDHPPALPLTDPRITVTKGPAGLGATLTAPHGEIRL